jgi:hypothetical protein
LALTVKQQGKTKVTLGLDQYSQAVVTGNGRWVLAFTAKQLG